MVAATTIYEPRCLWDYLRLSGDDLGNVFSRSRYVVPVVSTPGAFYNGERYPVEIHEIAVAPVNVLEWRASAPTLSVSSAFPMIATGRITVSLRGRAVTSRLSIPLSSFAWKYGGLTALPQTTLPNGGEASSAYGLVHKRFRQPVLLPQQGALEVRLSAVRRPPADVRATIAWFESGERFNGAGRFVSFPVSNLGETNPGLYGGPLVLNAPDPFGPGPNELWPPQQVFPAKAFRAQSPTRQGTQQILGMSVHVDQVVHDDVLAGDGFRYPAPIALRMGSRVRSVDGASLRDWWRPGAPLAITHTDIGPGLALELPRPLMLLPEDALDVEFEFLRPLDGVSGTLSLAVGFNGHAIIEG